MNKQTCCTTYVMSGLVMVKYWRAPARLLYSVVFSRGSPSVLDNFALVSIGVVVELQLSIPARLRTSRAYCSWLSRRPRSCWRTWMPRKCLRGPRSVMANSQQRHCMIEWRKEALLADKIMSSTYRRRYVVWLLLWRVKSEESDLEVVKPSLWRWDVNLRNQVLGACFNP